MMCSGNSQDIVAQTIRRYFQTRHFPLLTFCHETFVKAKVGTSLRPRVHVALLSLLCCIPFLVLAWLTPG